MARSPENAMNIVEKYLCKILYVKIYENRFVIKSIGTDVTPQIVLTPEPFSTPRLLVGQFMAAERCLKKAFKQMFAGKWLAVSPIVVIQPMEKIEGGLAEVEARAIQELVLAAGARKVTVYTGHELSDAEVLNHARRA